MHAVVLCDCVSDVRLRFCQRMGKRVLRNRVVEPTRPGERHTTNATVVQMEQLGTDCLSDWTNLAKWSGDRRQATCKICNRTLSIRAGHLRIFKRHLTRVHKIQLEEGRTSQRSNEAHVEPETNEALHCSSDVLDVAAVDNEPSVGPLTSRGESDVDPLQPSHEAASDERRTTDATVVEMEQLGTNCLSDWRNLAKWSRDRRHATCKICNRKLSTPAGNVHPLKRHLIHVHKIQLEEGRTRQRSSEAPVEPKTNETPRCSSDVLDVAAVDNEPSVGPLTSPEESDVVPLQPSDEELATACGFEWQMHGYRSSDFKDVVCKWCGSAFAVNEANPLEEFSRHLMEWHNILSLNGCAEPSGNRPSSERNLAMHGYYLSCDLCSSALFLSYAGLESHLVECHNLA
ncbi:hypothetical protein M514_04585 [Trichuris suis]|uniref:BED-type domain-containing protein n=1 Tax=Trichuris suis TaxID=68888 RepID=A0A085NV06_9BILA|nr:hypothetical protein M514_04585 [Trichuris suis]